MRKVNFFISSTFEDLKEHRRILLSSLAALKQEVEAMEYWSPDSQSSLSLCLEHIRMSDIYIGIIGTRYGFEPDDKKSITQYEYEEATRIGIKRLVYLIDEEHHKILFKDVDTGEKASKLKAFKTSLDKSIVRAKFSSPEDLVSKIITHSIHYLDTIGHNIKTLQNSDKVFNFSAKGAYDISISELTIDASRYLKLDNEGKTSLENVFLQKVLLGGIIAHQLNEEDYTCLNGITTFDHITWNVVASLIKLKPLNLIKFKQVLSSELEPFKIRLLILLAGEMNDEKLLDSVCSKTLNNLTVDSYFKKNGVNITPLYDIAKRAILNIASQKSKTIIESYILKASLQKKWKAKKLFESISNSLKQKDTK